MAVQLTPPSLAQLAPIKGLELYYAKAGIKKADKKDLLLIKINQAASVAGVFTQNRFCAAPVRICQQRLQVAHPIRALVINTGNANAGTGEQGMQDALAVCETVAQYCNIKAEQVLPFSTGVILEPLPTQKIQLALSTLYPANWVEAAETIMTTDTVPKATSRQFTLGDKTVSITGIAKGAGMIHPNMATMLSFIATDAAIEQTLLQTLTKEIADVSFNAISIDGDSSTNDSFIMVATGEQDPIQTDSDPRYPQLKTELTTVAQTLAQAIVRDGEGATKFITVTVEGGLTTHDCKTVAYAIARSPLVKTAFFASDPNLGRLLCAIGYSGVANLNVETIELYLNNVLVAEKGGRAASYQEEQGQTVMKADEITVRVNLNQGESKATVWTCDFSYDYVKINAEYRT